MLARLPLVAAYLDWYLDCYATEHPAAAGKARSEVKLFITKFGHRPIDRLRPMEMESYKRIDSSSTKQHQRRLGERSAGCRQDFLRGMKWKELDCNPLEDVKAPHGVCSVAVRFYDRDAMRKLYRANPVRAPL
ncbi:MULTISPECIES: hypothetical protein [Xanthomonas]|uniref:hypothetical protein n=1 Tax=Xanthomonas TaxID=338 RepID=UPI001290179E|nr:MULTISPECIES: hypothetical protein [Xanthomonas]